MNILLKNKYFLLWEKRRKLTSIVPNINLSITRISFGRISFQESDVIELKKKKEKKKKKGKCLANDHTSRPYHLSLN